MTVQLMTVGRRLQILRTTPQTHIPAYQRMGKWNYWLYMCYLFTRHTTKAPPSRSIWPAHACVCVFVFVRRIEMKHVKRPIYYWTFSIGLSGLDHSRISHVPHVPNRSSTGTKRDLPSFFAASTRSLGGPSIAVVRRRRLECWCDLRKTERTAV